VAIGKGKPCPRLDNRLEKEEDKGKKRKKRKNQIKIEKVLKYY